MYSSEYPKYPRNLTSIHARFVESSGGDDDWQTTIESNSTEIVGPRVTDGIETCSISLEKRQDEEN